MDNENARRTEKFIDSHWVEVPFTSLRAGDIFRLFEMPENKPVTWENDGHRTDFIALGDAEVPDTNVWIIKCEPKEV